MGYCRVINITNKRVLVVVVILLCASSVTPRVHHNALTESGGPGGGGGGGAGSETGPGENGGNGGGEGGGEGGQGGWGGPVSEGTDAECIEVAAQYCPTETILPNPNDCGSFCMCQESVGKFIPCADGLYFSEHLQLCTWPWEAECQYVTGTK